MIARAEICQLSLPEKFALLEVVWSELSTDPENIEIPPWHKDILDERERAVKSGTAQAIDWEVAKEQIKTRIQ